MPRAIESNIAGQESSTISVQPPTKERVILAVILFFTLMVAYIDRVNVSILLSDNSFLSQMGIKGHPVQMGLLMTLFLIAYGLANVFLSPLGDVFGPRKAMSFSIVMWIISVFFGGVATTFSFMLCSRVVLGIGEGLHWPMQSLFVKNWFSPSERGKANGAWLTGIMVGPAVAMPFFAWVVRAFGWRASFFVLVGLGIIPLLLLWFYVTDHPGQNKRVNRAELEYIEKGLKVEAEQEAKYKSASLAVRLKSFAFDYRFWLLTINLTCILSILWGTMAWLPTYLKTARGFSWAAMGALSSLPYILGIICMLTFGHLADKAGRRAPFIVLGHVGSAAGIYFGAHATNNLAAAILLSIGIASIAIGLPSAWALLQSIVPREAMGAGAGLANGVGNSLAALAPVTLGVFIKMTGSYVGGLMFLVGLAGIGFIATGILALQKY
jgi:sugar phosphate permease